MLTALLMAENNMNFTSLRPAHYRIHSDKKQEIPTTQMGEISRGSFVHIAQVPANVYNRGTLW